MQIHTQVKLNYIISFPKLQINVYLKFSLSHSDIYFVYLTDQLHQQQTANHDALLKRVIDLENEFYGSLSRITTILTRLDNLEIALQNNVTALNQRIVEETNAVSTILNQELFIVSGDLNNKINNLNADVGNLQSQINNINYNPYPTPPPSNPGSALDVYYNVTRRIDNLEYVKISNLTVDNNIWRRNFRVINSTFERIKSNNNCLCK